MAEGGQRCSAHTKARLERAAEQMRSAAASVKSKADMEHFRAARTNWEEAAVEYASTPAGAVALTERKAKAAADADAQTELMLDNIIRRGESMRAANEEIRVALSLAAFTQTELPEPVLDEIVAPDENDNALHGAGMEAWTRLVEAVSAEDSLTSHRHEFAKSDETIAARESDDEDLSYALHRLTTHTEPDPSWAKNERYTAFDEYPSERQVHWRLRPHREAFVAQMRRAVAHPNAGSKTLMAAAKSLPAEEVMTNPKLSMRDAATLMAYPNRFTNMSEAGWQHLRSRRDEHPRMLVAMAREDPDPYQREEAAASIVAMRWDEVTPSDMKVVREGLKSATFTDSQREMTEASMVDWVRHFGTDDHKNTVLTYQERNPAPVVVAEPERPKVSLFRR